MITTLVNSHSNHNHSYSYSYSYSHSHSRKHIHKHKHKHKHRQNEQKQREPILFFERASLTLAPYTSLILPYTTSYEEPHFIASSSTCFQRSATLHISGISLTAGASRRDESTSTSEQSLFAVRLFFSHPSLGTHILPSFSLHKFPPPNLCLGRNDAGGSLGHKHESMQAFLSFVGVANDSPRRSRKGAYSCHTFGTADQSVKVISERAFKSNTCMLSNYVFSLAHLQGMLQRNVTGSPQQQWPNPKLEQQFDPARLPCMIG
jgi:hypothetical protein